MLFIADTPYGRGFVAEKDIKKGTVIGKDFPLVSVPDTGSGQKACAHCLQFKEDLVKHPNCHCGHVNYCSMVTSPFSTTR